MARTQRQTEYIAMIEAGNESQPSAQLLLLSNDATVVGCTKALFQPSFFVCCLRNMRRTARWSRYGEGEQSTIRITKLDTAQSERALVIDTSPLEAVCPFCSPLPFSLSPLFLLPPLLKHRFFLNFFILRHDSALEKKKKERRQKNE